MPGGDRTGPMGLGAMTGRGAGLCAGFSVPGFANPRQGRGFSTGFGRGCGSGGRGGGRGWRNQFYATGQPGWMRFGGGAALGAEPDPEMEKRALKRQVETLRSELGLLEKRLGEMETRPTQE